MDDHAGFAGRLRTICLAIAPARLAAQLDAQPATAEVISAAQPQDRDTPAPPWP